jgi:PRC-barrel domain
MLRSVRQLYGKKLAASYSHIGHVKDFYFNDQQWRVRYVVADTGSWLAGRLVLISPHAFGKLHQEDDCLLVNLTRQQIPAGLGDHGKPRVSQLQSRCSQAAKYAP